MRARTGRRGRARPGRRGLPALACLAFLVLVAVPFARADDHEITITDAGFDPATITVLTGEPVTWINQSTAERAVISDDGTLNSGPLGRLEAYGHVFEAPGTFAYYEAGNPTLRAIITVEAAPLTAPPSGSIPPTPPPGTLPPDFSPAAPPSVAEPPTAVVLLPPSPAATPPPPSAPRQGDSPALFLAVLVVSVIAVGAAAATLIAASRRPDR